MVSYISSYNYNEIIKEAIEESKMNVLNSLVVNNFDLSTYVKQSLEQFKTLSTIIIDLSALEENDNNIYQAIENFRMVYSEIQIIIISPERKAGDSLLAAIFGLGIYDIIDCERFGDNEKWLKGEIKSSLEVKKSYKDSAIFKESKIEKEKNTKEKVIIKREIHQTVNKAVVGFMGTQSRIGVTHNIIVSAKYLSEKGFRVALVENSQHGNKAFIDIKRAYDDVKEEDDYFTLEHIDFYENYDLSQLHKIVAKNYNFILVDFGTFEEDYLKEFSRCVIQVIVAGSKPWEIDKINECFDKCSSEELKEFVYFFNFTSKAEMNDIRKGMANLNNVYFADYTPDPFEKNVLYSDLESIFKEYVGHKEEGKKKDLKGVILSVYKSIRK